LQQHSTVNTLKIQAFLARGETLKLLGSSRKSTVKQVHDEDQMPNRGGSFNVNKTASIFNTYNNQMKQ